MAAAASTRPLSPVVDAETRTPRRIFLIWGLLVFNVMPYANMPTAFHIPTTVGKILTQGALALAVVLAFTINRRVIVRSSFYLLLFSVLAGVALATSVQGLFPVGSTYRAVRLLGFLTVLWLLTPWWGRSDGLLVRLHLRWMSIALVTVVVGFLLAPSTATSDGRLKGVLWPIPATQVAHYSAVVCGLAAVLWLAGVIGARIAVVLVLSSGAILVSTHTRTAIVALILGVLAGGTSLFLTKRRARKAFAVAGMVLLVGAITLSPVVGRWFTRGQTASSLSDLTGRTQVWSALVAQPRPTLDVAFGSGMSNDSFNGLSIDSSWLSTYQDEGLFGDVIDGVVLIFLLAMATLRQKGPARAVAIFLVIYCMIASYTETGLGNASSYLMDLTVAASLLVQPVARAANELSPTTEIA